MKNFGRSIVVLAVLLFSTAQLALSDSEVEPAYCTSEEMVIKVHGPTGGMWISCIYEACYNSAGSKVSDNFYDCHELH